MLLLAAPFQNQFSLVNSPCNLTLPAPLKRVHWRVDPFSSSATFVLVRPVRFCVSILSNRSFPNATPLADGEILRVQQKSLDSHAEALFH